MNLSAIEVSLRADRRVEPSTRRSLTTQYHGGIMSSTRSLLAIVLLLFAAQLFAETTTTVDAKPPPDVVHGPLGAPQDFEIENVGNNTVTIYVGKSGAADFPEDWDTGDPLPEGWEAGATLESSEGTTVGAKAGGKIAAHAHTSKTTLKSTPL